MTANRFLTFLCAVTVPLAATASAPEHDLTERRLYNETAHIPPQCYTKTQDDTGKVHNPCYACHTESRRPNFVNDADLQLGYDFPLPAEKNPWSNLFQDRSAAVAAISDAEILDYIRRSNYFDENGKITPAQRLAEIPVGWDYNADGRWDGFVPDAWFNFDQQGFDRTPDGELTGWRAFAYQPFLGTFWPTNGSTDDVLIRLAEIFRRGVDGQPDLTVYKTNLAIVEAMIREADVAIAPVDEAALGGVDLDKDGAIGTARLIKYDWAPLKERLMWYVGEALEAQRAGKVHLAAGLYPEGTEFLHTVRYIDPDPSGANRLAPRIKEVRYAQKRYWMNYAAHEFRAAGEFKEKHDFPDRLRVIRGNLEAGVANDQGWFYAGMIEDAAGELRPQSYEELAFCVGCHSGIGATTDSSFAFPRKLQAGNSHRDGWYHWSQKDLRGLPERIRSDGQPEYAFYLASNGAGDEYRENPEVRARFFDAAGRPKAEMLQRLRQDISELLYASPARALQLAKAYRVIVREQSFNKGRDPVITPLRNVHRQVDGGTPTGVEQPLPGS
jgi:hypothetical protein